MRPSAAVAAVIGWLALLWLPLASAAAPDRPWLVCGEERSRLHLWSLFVLPGEQGWCHLEDAPAGARFVLQGEGVQAGGPSAGWSWRAPATPGMVTWTLRRQGHEDVVRVRVWVMLPATTVKNGRLGTFRVGSYPRAEPERGPLYQPPRGFVEVNPDNADMAVSPNYRLGQFVSKQSKDYPKYVVLRTRLLEKLEWLTAAAIRDGLAQGPFVIMSGYRTPHYNQLLNNRPLSRHLWGGAADIYIDDHPRDGQMDDLNGDGRIDKDDAYAFAAWLEREAEGPAYQTRFIGGLGVYGANSAHGPFVHVDVRGAHARW